MNDSESAILDLKQLIEMSSSKMNYVIELSELLSEVGRYEEATVESYRKVAIRWKTSNT